MDYLKKIVTEIELHSVDGIRNCFENFVSPNVLYNNEPLIYELTSEYTRSPRFKDCVKLFVNYGLQFEEKALLAVLLNDDEMLREQIALDKTIPLKKYSLRCAYTALHEVTLLHICAEFNHVACAEVLIKHGTDINAKAGTDENDFGGQTPIFHTVNQNNNQSEEMMQYLLGCRADLNITVKGIIWGKGYEWETFIPAVNPISYAMMGLLPQMHRNEKIITDVVSLLIKQAHGINYIPSNVPNKYLYA